MISKSTSAREMHGADMQFKRSRCVQWLIRYFGVIVFSLTSTTTLRNPQSIQEQWNWIKFATRNLLTEDFAIVHRTQGSIKKLSLNINSQIHRLLIFNICKTNIFNLRKENYYFYIELCVAIYSSLIVFTLSHLKHTHNVCVCVFARARVGYADSRVCLYEQFANWKTF